MSVACHRCESSEIQSERLSWEGGRSACAWHVGLSSSWYCSAHTLRRASPAPPGRPRRFACVLLLPRARRSARRCRLERPSKSAHAIRNGATSPPEVRTGTRHASTCRRNGRLYARGAPGGGTSTLAVSGFPRRHTRLMALHRQAQALSAGTELTASACRVGALAPITGESPVGCRERSPRLQGISSCRGCVEVSRRPRSRD